MFFYLKKFISLFFEPLTISFILFCIGLYHLYKKEANHKKGRAFVTAGVITLFLLSWSPFSYLLAHPFEFQHKAYKDKIDGDQFDYIMVLGSGYAENHELPATTKLGGQGLSRVIEGIRLHRMFPESKIIFSGYGGSYDTPYSQIATEAAIDLGVDPEKIIQIPEAKDTIDEANMSFKVIGEKRFLLVSSASHLPRSMGLFKNLGMKPTASPTDFINTGNWKLFTNPDSFGLYKSERAIYEGMGTTWAWLTGRL